MVTFDNWLDSVRTTAAGGLPGGGKSPYKPLLLAAVLSRIAQGKLVHPEVRLDQGTRALYRQLRGLAFPSCHSRTTRDSRLSVSRLRSGR